MSLHRRLLWVHKTYPPEVFLRTLAVLQGQHRGGQQGRTGLERTAWDVVAPEYAIGLNDLPSQQDPADLATLTQQADAIAAWLKSHDDDDLIVIDDVHVKSPWSMGRTTPEHSRFERLVPWVARLINSRVKHKDRALQRGGVKASSWYDAREAADRDLGGHYRPPPAFSPAEAQLRESRFLLLRFWEGSNMASARWPGRALSQSPVTDEDVILANDLVLLSQSLREIADWAQATRGVDLMSLDLHDAVNASHAYHEELRLQRKAEGARGEPGAVIRRWPDGWTLQLLQTPAQLKAEGEAMGHCVGDGGYLDDLTAILSLRDSKGDPHVTIELELQEYENYEIMAGSHPIVPPHLAEHLGEQRLPRDCRVAYRNEYGDQIILLGGWIAQIVGKGNETPHPKYVDRAAEGLSTLDLDYDRDYSWMMRPQGSVRSTLRNDFGVTSPPYITDQIREAEKKAPSLFAAERIAQAIDEADTFPGLVRVWALLSANARATAAAGGTGHALWVAARDTFAETLGGSLDYRYDYPVIAPYLRADLPHARQRGRTPDVTFEAWPSWWEDGKLKTLKPYLPVRDESR